LRCFQSSNFDETVVIEVTIKRKNPLFQDFWFSD